MKTEAVFNANEYVQVRLTDHGRKIVKEDYDNNFPLHLRDKYPFEPKKEDAEGYCKFQMWDFMRIFGPHLSLGAVNPFEMEIKIPVTVKLEFR